MSVFPARFGQVAKRLDAISIASDVPQPPPGLSDRIRGYIENVIPRTFTRVKVGVTDEEMGALVDAISANAISPQSVDTLRAKKIPQDTNTHVINTTLFDKSTLEQRVKLFRAFMAVFDGEDDLKDRLRCPSARSIFLAVLRLRAINKPPQEITRRIMNRITSSVKPKKLAKIEHDDEFSDALEVLETSHEGELAELQTRLAALEAELAAARERISELDGNQPSVDIQELEHLNSQLAAQVAMRGTLEADLASARTRVESAAHAPPQQFLNPMYADDDIQALEDLNQQLQQSIAAKEQESDSLKVQLAAAQSRIAELEVAHAPVFAGEQELQDLELLNQQLQDALKEKEASDTEVAKAEALKQQYQSQVEVLTAQLAERQQAVDTTAAQLAASHTDKDGLQGMVQTLKTSLSAMQTERDQLSAQILTLRAELASQLGERLASTQQLASRMQTLEASIQEGRGRVQTLEADLVTTQAARDQMSSQLATTQAQFEGQVQELETNLSSAQAERDLLDGRVQALEGVLAAVQQERDQLAASLASTRAERDQLKGQVQALETSAQAGRDKLDDRVTSLEAAVDAKQTQLDGVKMQLTKAQAGIGSDLSAVRAERDTFRDKVVTAQSQLLILRGERDASMARVSAAQDQVELLRKELQGARDTAAQLAASREGMDTSDKLRSQLAAAIKAEGERAAVVAQLERQVRAITQERNLLKEAEGRATLERRLKHELKSFEHKAATTSGSLTMALEQRMKEKGYFPTRKGEWIREGQIASPDVWLDAAGELTRKVERNR